MDQSEFYYKELEIPNYETIIKEITDLHNAENYPDDNSLFTKVNLFKLRRLCPTLKEWLLEHNLTLSTVALVKCAPNKMDYLPHIDDQSSSLAINFPLYNCNIPWVNFYKLTKGSFVKRIQKNKVIFNGPSDDAEFEEVCTYRLTGPLLLNIKQPHAIFNPTDEVRLSLTMRFFRDPWEMI